MRKAARRCSSCTTSIPRRKLSTVPSPPGVPVVIWARRSSNWTSFSSPWARAWDGHEVGAALAVAACIVQPTLPWVKDGELYDGLDQRDEGGRASPENGA